MNQLHQSVITQTKNLENSILLYIKESEYFTDMIKKNPQYGIEVMTTVLPKVAQLQYLLVKNHYEDGEYEAYEMNRIMAEIEPIIEDGFGNGAYEVELEHLQNQFEFLKEIIGKITAKYYED